MKFNTLAVAVLALAYAPTFITGRQVLYEERSTSNQLLFDERSSQPLEIRAADAQVVNLVQRETRDAEPESTLELAKRRIIIIYGGSTKIFIRKRNAHACLMSTTFIVVYPVAALSLHLPNPLRIPIVPYIHGPLQILGLCMMIAAFGLGIDLAHILHYLGPRHGPVKAHIICGFIAVLTIILVQPAAGIMQHRHFKKTGQKSIWAYIHRWVGRGAIILGMINSGLGFQLAEIGPIVKPHSLIRNFVLMGVLGGAWLLLCLFDWYRGRNAPRATTATGEKSEFGEDKEAQPNGNGVLATREGEQT